MSATIIPVRGFTPRIGEGTFVAPNASIIGDVVIGRDCSIWFNTVIRGDVNSIRIADRVNIQDGTVLHTLYQKSTIEIGEDVSIGHNVTLHGCHIRPFALIGMGAVVMDDAVVGEGARSRRIGSALAHTDRPQRALGRSTRQIHQDGRPRSGARTQHQDSSQLSDVLALVHRSRQRHGSSVSGRDPQ